VCGIVSLGGKHRAQIQEAPGGLSAQIQVRLSTQTAELNIPEVFENSSRA